MRHVFHRTLLGPACAAAAFTAGCTTTTESRSSALAASAALSRYHEDRQQSIDTLNARYRAVYASLMREHVESTRDLLRLERKADARQAADAMLLDPEAETTFTAICDALAEARDTQLRRAQTRAEVIAAARAKYAASFTELKVDLEKIKTAQRQLTELGQEEDARRRTAEFITTLARVYQESQKN